jgi:hypothetical protein
LFIPVILENAGLLAAFAHWGASPVHRIVDYAHGSEQLPATCIINDLGDIPERVELLVVK